MKPIFCATAILGYHITRPFHRLLLDTDPSFTTLLIAFPKLLEELEMSDRELCSPTVFQRIFLQTQFAFCIFMKISKRQKC